MVNRRKFLIGSLLASSGIFIKKSFGISTNDPVDMVSKTNNEDTPVKPVVVSTWKHGLAANVAAMEVLSENGRALDAVEQGVRVSESDPNVTSVGYGGMPDRDGKVTLDSCIMDEEGNCGSVGFLQHIKNPVSVARLVMEKTPHIMLAGEGALKFALANGFKKENLLTDNAKTRWQEWVKENNYTPEKIDMDNHDTIGLLALDSNGNLSGACTTSGLAWKYHGRVGDSPIIGAGLFVDNSVGAATATGKGESVIKIAGTAVIVELMRYGMPPQDACVKVIKRIIDSQKDFRDFQVGFIAMNKRGDIGACSIQKGFTYSLHKDGENKLINSKYFVGE